MDHLHRAVVHLLRLHAEGGPHEVDRLHEAGSPVHLSAEGEDPGPEGVQGPEASGGTFPGIHVGTTVPEATIDLVGQVLIHRADAGFPHVLEVRVVEEDPGLEEVLVVGVDHPREVGGRVLPLARFHVDGSAHETDLGAPLEKGHDPRLRLVIVGRVSCHPAEGAEFQHQCPDLRRVVDLPLLLSGPEVHPHVGHARGRLEGREQAVGEIGGQLEKAGVTVHLVSRQKASEDADGDFEELDGKVVVEGKPLQDQRLRLGGLFFQSHEEHGVERVERSHDQGNVMPVSSRAAERSESVKPPSVFEVTLPCMEELRLHGLGHLGVCREVGGQWNGGLTRGARSGRWNGGFGRHPVQPLIGLARGPGLPARSPR